MRGHTPPPFHVLTDLDVVKVQGLQKEKSQIEKEIHQDNNFLYAEPKKQATDYRPPADTQAYKELYGAKAPDAESHLSAYLRAD